MVDQSAAATRTFELFTSEKWASTGVLPELALFDCHACHHPLTAPRWAARATTGLPPGVPHINDAHVLMLLYMTKASAPSLAAQLHKTLLDLHQSSNHGRVTRLIAGLV